MTCKLQKIHNATLEIAFHKKKLILLKCVKQEQISDVDKRRTQDAKG